MPGLQHVANGGTRWSLHFHLEREADRVRQDTVAKALHWCCLWFRTSLNLPLLLSTAHSGPGSILSTSHHKTYATHLLKATGAAAAATVEWADEAEHLTVPRVR